MKRALILGGTGALALAGIVVLANLWPENPTTPPAPEPKPPPIVEPEPPKPRVAIAEEAVPSFERGKAVLDGCEAERHEAGLDIKAHRARLREAVDSFDESARLCKFHAMTYRLRGRAKELLGDDPEPDYAEARRWNSDAAFPEFPAPANLAEARHDVRLLRERGQERIDAGDLDGAQRDFELVIELADPPYAFEKIAGIELQRARTEGRNAYVRGLRAVNIAMARDGHTLPRLRLRAELNEGVGFRSEAVGDLEAALKLCAPAERAAVEARLAELRGPR